MGRPSKYSQKLADAICEKLADGKSLRTICSTAAMPSRSTVFRWLAENDAFRDQYARAREDQADTLADEIVSIADKAMVGEKVKRNAAGEIIERVTGDMVERSKLRIDARKWVAAKLKPKKYGDRLALDHDVVGNLADRLKAARERAASQDE